MGKLVIGICTSALKSNINDFISKVKNQLDVDTRFIQLPYNDLDYFRLSNEGLDGLIICHSIHNRRFAITDVMDALYDKFLPRVKSLFEQKNICVIAHDFSSLQGADGAKGKMESFRTLQPTTFECCNLAVVCGKLDTEVDIGREDWVQLEKFVRQCRRVPPPPAAAVSSSTRPANPKTSIIIQGVTIDFSDPRVLAVLAIMVLAVILMWSRVKETVKWFLYCSLTIGVYYAFLLALIPAIFRVYYSRRRAEILRNENYWYATLVLSSNLLLLSAIRLYQAGGLLVFSLPVLPLVGRVYQMRKKNTQRRLFPKLPDRAETFHWFKLPMWKLPYRFWQHYLDTAAKYVNELF